MTAEIRDAPPRVMQCRVVRTSLRTHDVLRLRLAISRRAHTFPPANSPSSNSPLRRSARDYSMSNRPTKRCWSSISAALTRRKRPDPVPAAQVLRPVRGLRNPFWHLLSREQHPGSVHRDCGVTGLAPIAPLSPLRWARTDRPVMCTSACAESATFTARAEFARLGRRAIEPRVHVCYRTSPASSEQFRRAQQVCRRWYDPADTAFRSPSDLWRAPAMMMRRRKPCASWRVARTTRLR